MTEDNIQEPTSAQNVGASETVLEQQHIHAALKEMLVTKGLISQEESDSSEWPLVADAAYKSYALNKMGIANAAIPNSLETVPGMLLDDEHFSLHGEEVNGSESDDEEEDEDEEDEEDEEEDEEEEEEETPAEGKEDLSAEGKE